MPETAKTPLRVSGARRARRPYHDAMANPDAPSPRRPFTEARATRRLPLHAPQRAWAMSEWALLPLRLFVGVTFVYAGLQKLANPAFTTAASSVSIQHQMAFAVTTSPIGGLLAHLVGEARIIGVVLASGELVVGLGTVLGLWTRVAAAGGLLISLSLFLTVSFHTTPYFTGSDIVFFFAWIPLLIAGGGSRLSVDAKLAQIAARQQGAPPPTLVPIAFASVQSICGHYDDGRCRALRAPCGPAHCPVLAGERPSLYDRRHLDAVDRRTLIAGTSAVVGGVAGAIAIGGITAEGGKILSSGSSGGGRTLSPTTATGTPPSTTSAPTASTGATGAPTTTAPPTTTAHPKGTLLGSASQVPTNQAASFTIPKSGDPGIVVHTKEGLFVAYDAVCPHLGCTVGYAPSVQLIVCPCHGSEFEVMTGDVIAGPAPHGLTKLDVVEEGNGNLYLQ